MHSDKFKYSMAPIAKEDWDRIFGGFIQHSPLEGSKETKVTKRTPLPNVLRGRSNTSCKCGRSHNTP
jgi:hypothetical protein